MEQLSNLPVAEQKSDAWLKSRQGKFTCSEFYRLMADAKRPMTKAELDAREKGSRTTTIVDDSLLSDGAMTYVYEKAAEIMTGHSAKDDISNKYTEWGEMYEPHAAAFYSKVFKVDLEIVHNIVYDEYTSGSPDRLVGDQGGLEIKCPYLISQHLENLLLVNQDELKELHKDYYVQCMGYMFITGRKWWDFVSYHPFFEGAKKMQRIRVERRDDEIKLLSTKLISAKANLKHIIDNL